jgi:hypothetical protein
MSFFSLLESFFFLSLGITFVLIFLIVFHFKQRILTLEKKGESLTDLCNLIIEELTKLRIQQNLYLNRNPVHSFVPPSIPFSINTTIPIPLNKIEENTSIYKKIVVKDDILKETNVLNPWEQLHVIPSDEEEEEEEDEKEDDNDDEEEYDYEEEDDNEQEDNNNEEEEEKEEEDNQKNKTEEEKNINFDIHTLKFVDLSEKTDSEINIQPEQTKTIFMESVELEIDNSSENTSVQTIKINKMNMELENNIESDHESSIEHQESVSNNIADKNNYNKMNVPTLRSVVISKGLHSDTSKLKRADLIRILNESI